jgi:glutamate/tyrosine decarboxylase-like PLP-dependent enzyme
MENYLSQILQQNEAWKESFGSFSPAYPIPSHFDAILDEYLQRLNGNYPFFHPNYAGQMLKPPHPVAILGYFAAQLHNPNNHALDGGKPTAEMESEVIQDLATMFGFEANALGHLCASGTIANLEALWISRCLHPTKKIAYSADAHYTHERMCGVLGIESVKIATDTTGKLNIEALEKALSTGEIGTLVCTAGTTGLGTVDAIAQIIPICKKYNVRVHIDGAYGGFFTIIARQLSPEALSDITDFPAADFQAIAQADSIVVDPHKQGLQPYGCGAVLFKDATVARFYTHDSPYTYFTSKERHLGEISLECSRAGASAGALWLTLKTFPLDMNGLGAMLLDNLKAARLWAAKIAESNVFTNFTMPELDIVSYFPNVESAAAIDLASQEIFDKGMQADNPIFLSLYRMSQAKMAAQFPHLDVQQDTRILRSVLLKPEHLQQIDSLHKSLLSLR